MRNNYKPRSTFICKKRQLQDKKRTLSLTKIFFGHNIDLGSRVTISLCTKANCTLAKQEHFLSLTNIDLGHRERIALRFTRP